jgi:hypothetical protein
MNVDILIPFRGGEKHRERNFKYVFAWWENLGYRIHVADDGAGGPMNRSRARNEAAKRATSDVLVFADADTVGQPESVAAAARHAYQTGELSYPFIRFEGLSSAQTVKFMAGKPYGRGKTKRHPSPGGIVIVHRDLFEFAGRYDEAFEGWGYEDVAFARAARTLGGQHRENGVIYHLWHPVAPEKADSIRAKTGNRNRADRYAQADGDPEAMRQLIVNR